MKPTLIAVVALLSLSSCAAPSPVATPVNVNVAACGAFVDVFNGLNHAQQDRNAETLTVDEWRTIMNSAGTDYAAVALTAEGDVKERINDLIDVIDANGMTAFLISGPKADAYFAKLERVGQACPAEGYELGFDAN
jgi:hypothetical protein